MRNKLFEKVLNEIPEETYLKIRKYTDMVEKMNLMKELQETSKWKEFETWYEMWRNDHKKNYHTFNIEVFKEYCIDVQKSIFEKFIESQGYEIHYMGDYDLYYKNQYILIDNLLPHWETFEQLLIWYFTHDR